MIMEISKLTISRDDVIVISDTETQQTDLKSNKQKKLKLKTECVRNVKMTTVTVNRIVPFCHRQRCRYSQRYHRHTSKNTKYQKRVVIERNMNCKRRIAPDKKILYEQDKNQDRHYVLNRDLYSPITVESSSDTYENISSCSFDIMSSDSDEIEDLIKMTRKRMKNENTFNSYLLKNSVCAATTQDDYQNISSNDEVLDGSSIHSMDTVVLCHDDTISSHSISPDILNQDKLKYNHNSIEPMLLSGSPNQNSIKLCDQNISSLSNQDNNDSFPPLYEISEKVLMEHYLKTTFI